MLTVEESQENFSSPSTVSSNHGSPKSILPSKASIQDNINKMYTIDENGFMECISFVMNRNKSKITMSQTDKEIMNAWAEFAVSLNADKLYESAE
jgi:hypothetical protein